MKTFVQTLAILFLLITSIYPAWAVTCQDGTAGTTVFYANGVNNDQREAIKSAVKLGIKLKDFISKNPPQSWCFQGLALAFNNNEFFLLDFLESARQLISLSDEDFWRFWYDPILASAPFSKTFVDHILSIDLISYVIDADLREHVRQYKKVIAAGNKVVVVPHSQGNLYANQAHSFLSQMEKDSFRIVSVATPASFVAGSTPGHEPYTTLKEDPIRFVPGALDPNTSNGDCGSLFACHAFVSSYLDGSVSGPRILNHIAGIILIGTIRDADTNGPITGVEVQIQSFENGIPLITKTQTNANGSYAFTTDDVIGALDSVFVTASLSGYVDLGRSSKFDAHVLLLEDMLHRENPAIFDIRMQKNAPPPPSEPPPGPSVGTIEIKRVDGTGLALPNAIPTSARVDGGALRTDNPAFFTNLLVRLSFRLELI